VCLPSYIAMVHHVLGFDCCISPKDGNEEGLDPKPTGFGPNGDRGGSTFRLVGF
jgi:hypothetical protein